MEKPQLSFKEAQEEVITEERTLYLRDFIVEAVGVYRKNTGVLPE
jgi:hypothetical protein